MKADLYIFQISFAFLLLLDHVGQILQNITELQTEKWYIKKEN